MELASLLHDLGKIAVPDAVLAKTMGPLTETEQRALADQWEAGVNILACCCSSQRVLDAVAYAGVRFDGSGAGGGTIAGEHIPLESRMIAIVDAFDAMTAADAGRTPHSREQALKELTAGSGTLFDPILVNQFIELLSHEQEALTAASRRPLVQRAGQAAVRAAVAGAPGGRSRRRRPSLLARRCSSSS